MYRTQLTEKNTALLELQVLLKIIVERFFLWEAGVVAVLCYFEASLGYPVWIRKMIRTASNDRLLHSMPICKTARWRGSRFDGFWEPKNRTSFG